MDSQQSPKWISNNENPNTAISKGVSIVEGARSVAINNTIYVYGFSKPTAASFNKNITSNVWSIASNEVVSNTPLTSLAVSNVSSNTTNHSTSDLQPYLPYAQGVASNRSDEVIVFALSVQEQLSMEPWIRTSSSLRGNATDEASNAIPFSVFKFDLIKRGHWTEIASSSTVAPVYRKEHSITSSSSKDTVYLFGGVNSTHSQQDFWTYSLLDFQWKKLDIPSTIKPRCGHTVSMLSDGRMVFIGGYYCTKMPQLQLFDMTDVVVFDTTLSTWERPPEIKGIAPRPRLFHSAIAAGPNNDIFICGGQDNVQAPYHTYIGSQRDQLADMTAILDTNAWTWRVPTFSIFQPLPQSHASISIINDTKIVFGFGINYQTIYDNFHVFDMSKQIWEPPTAVRGLGERTIVNSIFNKNGVISNAVLWISLGCLLSTIVVSYMIAIWTFGLKRFHMKVYTAYKAVKKEIWKPRVGEPGWAESSRLLLKTLFLMLFVYLIFTLSTQVLNSPIIDQLSYESNDQMLIDVPDVKFCFEHWEETNDPIIQCTTDFGAQCSNFFYQLPKKTNAEGTNSVCSLFRAPTTFKLGQTSKRSLDSSGSFLKFDYYSANGKNSTLVSSKEQQVNVELYNKLHDPSLELYRSTLNQAISNLTSLAFEWNSNEEESMYRSESDLAGQADKNAYRLSTRLMSTISFELIKRISLESSIWNYIGIAPSISTRYEIDTMTASESFPLEYNPLSSSVQPFGSLHVFPANYQTKVLREQKAFAFINAIGIFGGLFGLLFSLQTCLFGYRPRSPWGYMHRWSFGQFRSSLMNGLHANFFPSTMKAFTNHRYLSLEHPSSSVQPLQQHVSDYSIASSTLSSQHHQSNYFHPANAMPSTSKHGLHPLTIPTAEAKSNANCLLSPSPIINFSEMKGKRGSELRMTLIEERIYTLERLFQAYYIDDEIFRSLDRALQADRRRADAMSSSSSSSSVGDSSQNSTKVALEKRRFNRKEDV
ncbi:negative regulator of the PHO system [Mucor velutinosus]|uniref:Negative regulator of the PHO system n=1 Tax=Mucor velutinosus TaxID=708070 RepID=A0AAN7HMF1_9FUNG|nr:negative regulator of the PHO system [Mucor velutinosus]